MPDLFVGKKKKDNSLATLSIAKRPSKAIGIFSTLSLLPGNVTFENQEPDEKVVLFIRRHFITNASWILTALVLLITPLGVSLFLTGFDVFSLLSDVPNRYLLILLSFYYLIIVGFILIQFTTWFYQVGLVTSQRIIDIDFTSLLFHKTAVTNISSVVDVEYTQGGLLRSSLDFGDVFIQTEGIKPNFEFHAVPKPAVIADTILDLKREIGNHE